MAADVDRGEDEVAELVGDGFLVAFRQRLAKFADFFLDLVEDGGGFLPVEADLGGLFLDLQRLGQRGNERWTEPSRPLFGST